jgi:GNAT superfamily N-acetyltransferase
MSPRRSKAGDTKNLLRAANSLKERQFAEKYLHSDRTITATKDEQYTTYPYTFHTSSNLLPEDLQACFDLIEETSSADYKTASQGWHPHEKLIEMMDTDMRYILVQCEEELMAFTSFMLCEEEDVPVVYVYEIHLSSKLRGSGVGKALMHIVEDVGRKVGVEMSMLTVFTANAHAEEFYRRLGYTEDASSPQARKLRGGKVKRPEYLIMSKTLRDEGGTAAKRRKKSGFGM